MEGLLLCAASLVVLVGLGALVAAPHPRRGGECRRLPIPSSTSATAQPNRGFFG
jgi:hypothetical protein